MAGEGDLTDLGQVLLGLGLASVRGGVAGDRGSRGRQVLLVGSRRVCGWHRVLVGVGLLNLSGSRAVELGEVLLHVTDGRVVGEQGRADLHVEFLTEDGRDGEGEQGVNTEILEVSIINKLGLVDLSLLGQDLHDLGGETATA